MFTTGGRGGAIIEVTSLADSGDGSLRAAVETPGPRIIVFRIAGIIQLESAIDIEYPDITIAGQSAPGDGICLAHDSVNINTHNVIIRHIRIRRGRPEGGQGSDNLGGNPQRQIMIDHCSTSWGMDENLSLYRWMTVDAEGRSIKEPVRNLTVQYCISSEALNAKNHAFGGTWGGQDATFHHNLFACNTGRNPSIGMGGEFDFRNNVLFNWRHRTMDGGDETSLINVINNYYKPGPATEQSMRATIARVEARQQYSPGRRFEQEGWYPPSARRPGKWYVAGNTVAGDAEVTNDNWLGMKSQSRESADPRARVATPFEAWPVAQETSDEAFATVLQHAGATLPRRDAIDERVVAMVRSGVVGIRDGIVEDPREVGGYPVYGLRGETPPADTDHDGMPDAWETAHQLDPDDPADGRLDSDQDGYTNVEEFLNGTSPIEFVDYLRLNNNVDTISR